jgi:hypothetical protein
MPGTHLSVVSPGKVRAGDPVATVDHLAHGVTVAQVFRAITLAPDLLPSIPAAEEPQEGTEEWPRAERTFALGWAEPAAMGRPGVEECAGVAVPMAARGQIGWAQALEVDALGRGVVVDAGSALEGRRGFTGRRPAACLKDFGNSCPTGSIG